jgi:hypothetical protein
VTVTTGRTYTITQKEVSLAAIKVYDAGTGLSGSQLVITTGVGSETLTYSGATISNANVATANKFVSAVTLGNGSNGGLASNYKLPALNVASVKNTAVVNPATVTLTASKEYDADVLFGSNKIIVSTGIAGQALTLTGSAFANSANVLNVNLLSTGSDLASGATGLVLANGTGGVATNYILPSSSSNVTITAKAITGLIILNPTKIYDGSDVATLSVGNYALSGFVAGQGASVNQSSGLYNSKNASLNSTNPANTVTASLALADFAGNSGTLLSNYALPTSASGSGTINQAPVTLIADSYAAFPGDVNNTFTGSVVGAVNSDNLTVSVAKSGNTLTPSLSGLSSVTQNYVAQSVVTGTYTNVAAYQLVVRAVNTTATYGDIAKSDNAQSAVNMLAQYCISNSNCTSGNVITLALTAPSGAGNTVGGISTTSANSAIWTAVATNSDSTTSSYALKAISSTSLSSSFSGADK